MVRVKRRRGQRKKSAWSQSSEFKAVARAALFAINSRNVYLPKCGALAKSTGEPCRNVAMGNGRCRFHGGATPRGDDWHTRQTPNTSTKSALRKLDAKIAKAAKAAKEKRQRLRIATDAERAAHEKWQWHHPAGNAARRSARRLEKRIDEETRHLKTEIGVRPTSPEVQELEARIAELKADQAKRKALREGYESGVFL